MSEVSRSELEKMTCPPLTKQILYCLDYFHLIIPLFKSRPITVLNVNSSHSGVQTEQNCDRVTLSLPLCQDCVSWELIFDHTQLDMPPDFTFGDDFNPDLGSLKRLEIYSLACPDSLLLLLQELFELYRQFNYNKAMGDERMGFELNMMNEAGINQFSVLAKETHSRSQEGSHGLPFFFLELPIEVDFTRLPPTLGLPEEELIPPSLLIRFKSPTQVQTKLIISSKLERTLSKASGISLSMEPWGGNWGSIVTDYLPQATETLSNVIGFISNSYHKRKEFTLSLFQTMGNSVLEFDDEEYLQIVLLMEDRGFSFVVHITNHHTFPDSKPTLTFQSVYHFQSVYTPFHKVYDNYPYSPRWSCEEFVHRLRTYIKDSVDVFKLASLQGGKLRV